MSVTRQHSESPEMSTFEPRPFVTVLRSAGELEDALRRAALCERRAAQITGERAARCEALMRLSSARELARMESASPLASLENGKANGQYQAA
jgi:hypothetical protein